MCCLVSSLLLFAPRLAILLWWLLNSARFNLAFNTKVWPLHLPWPFWVWPVIGRHFRAVDDPGVSYRRSRRRRGPGLALAGGRLVARPCLARRRLPQPRPNPTSST